MIYHGIGLKQSYYRDVSDRINLWIIESEKRFEELSALGKTNISLCGFAKLDLLDNRSPSIQSDWINMQPVKDPDKIILYAPTFYPSSLEYVFPQLTKLPANYTILIKLHHFSWYLKKYRHHNQIAKELANQNDNIFLAPPDQFNVIPFYLKARLMITDVSSTMFEFLTLNRPIIQTAFYKKRIKHKLFPGILDRRLDQKRFEEIDFTERVSNPEHLSDVVQDAFTHPDRLKQQRLKALDTFLYKVDGKTSVRIVDALEEQIKNGKK
jgi:CDP-glycerol glycerophosphotransferase (TagB/SpsB family)